MQLNGKVAVVTGGSRGIGKATATEFVKRGVKVVIGDVLDTEGEATVRELNESSAGERVAVYKHANVAVYQDNIDLFQAAEDAFGAVDIAILNAGVGKDCNVIFGPLDDKRDDHLFQVDVFGGPLSRNTSLDVQIFDTHGFPSRTKVAVLHMAKHGKGGCIVATASTCSFQTPPAMGTYNAAKHAVAGWVRTLDWMPQVCGVRVNAVCPAWVDTDLLTDFGKRGVEPYWEVADALPRAKMETVVEGFLRLIQDDSKSGSTLLVLPKGLEECPRPPVFESSVNDATNRALDKYQYTMVDRYKQELKEALERYK
ncbi:hypothetical protein BDB00DRAFT_877198 [Zychaea mexicana]|uniref:uncharacterized protein n=1 Tax=Zychaea mexicana TaxID=64656 RepID=UPI0022FECEA5|nr:uncharacterized protein BDB00DRAFT_877198 [Zychaea mexicana]KAI9488619.1 hypothetical protein BDB00DRAFT_877198 [Zychaea mexicana]